MEKKKIAVQETLEKSIFQIPEKLEKSNLFIEIKSMNKAANLRFFSTSLKAQIIENYGQIKITDKEDKPLSKVRILAKLNILCF